MKDLIIDVQTFLTSSNTWTTWRLLSTQWGYPYSPRFNVQPGPPTTVAILTNNGQVTYNSLINLGISNIQFKGSFYYD